MSTTIVEGKRVREIELLDLFPSSEGMICQYYGRIGSGKTYSATSDILDLLRKGKVVYANWKINYKGYDERISWPYLFLGLLFPWVKRYFSFPKENLQYFEISNEWAKKQGYRDFDHWVSTRTDCYMFADEGHVWFDSYSSTRLPMERRTIALHTRHFNRTICIISQRPTAIHVSMRANVNVFYKCEKIFQWGSLVRFKRSEYQDMVSENVDDGLDREGNEKALSRKWYWGHKDIFEAYTSRYLRGDMPDSQKVLFQAYDFTYWDKIKALYRLIFGYPQSKPRKGSVPIDKKMLSYLYGKKSVQDREGFASSQVDKHEQGL